MPKQPGSERPRRIRKDRGAASAPQRTRRSRAASAQNSPPLYLRRLHVRNMRGFQDVDIDFMRGEGPRMRSIVVGRNGSGKTSLLRAIAMGLCQQSETSGLMGSLGGELVRRNKYGNYAAHALIELELFDPAAPGDTFRTTTKVIRDDLGDQRVEKATEPDPFPWERIFVGGYGVDRGARNRDSREGYSRAEALRSLFSDTALLDPEATLRAIKLADAESKDSRPQMLQATKQHLRELLRLNPNHEIEVSARAVLVHGPWGAMPFHALGDGYRGTAGWVLDLLGMALAAGRLDDIKRVRGIVLIDEVDEHLHPSWQREILPLLGRRFPELQIVGTTHSAMTIVECEPDELIACRLHNAIASAHQNLPGPQGYSADEILRGEWFGLASTLDRKTYELLHEYQQAVEARRAESEVAPLREKLRERLGRRFDSPIDELALEIAAEYRRQQRAEVSPDQRRELVTRGVAELRARIASHGMSRGRS